jgi:hypothetical protein
MNDTAADTAPIEGERKHAVFPSDEFPGPPTIGLSIPSNWVLIEPADYVQPLRKIDLAVCAPAPIDGVTPSVVASVIRTLPVEDPESVLTDLLNREVAEQSSSEVLTSRYQTDPRPSLNALIRDQFPGKVMEHLQVLTYVHDDRLAHILNVTGVYAAGSKQGRRAIFDVIGPTGAVE